MAGAIDLTGQIFGRLIVIERATNTPRGGARWLVKCSCGSEAFITQANHLRAGKIQSCGCYSNERKHERFFQDLTGLTFGKLTVLYHIENKSKETWWMVQCSCGSESFAVRAGSLKAKNHTQSCGCYHKEILANRLEDLQGKTFGKVFVLERANSRIQPSGQRKTRWLVQCACGSKPFITSAYDLKIGGTTSCGCLKESWIASELKRYCAHNYNAIAEYKILKNPNTKMWLPYDIYIPQNNAFIEINGMQHYQRTNLSRTEEDFLSLRKRDKIKKQYAKVNGRYIEIDLRKIKSVKEAIEYLEGELWQTD